MRSPARLLIALFAGAVLLGAAGVARASGVDVAVVDVTAPTGAVALDAGGSAGITVNMTVTGSQVGTATFTVNRDWTLSGGTFVGSNPVTFTVNPRAAQDPANTFSTAGTVNVAASQAAGTFTLAVSAFGITNTNQPGAKLSDGADSSYSVTVNSAPTCAAPVITGQPAAAAVAYGSSASFGAVATGWTSVQWQKRATSAEPWTDVSGATSATLSLTKPTVAMSGSSFRAVFTKTCAVGSAQATSESAQLTVSKKGLTVTASSDEVTYGDAAPAITAGYDGFVAGEGALDLGTAPTCSTTYDQGDPVVPVGYPSTCSGGVSGNYSFTYVDGVVTVLKKGLTVTASSDEVTYGDAAPAITAGYDGFITGENALDLDTAPTCSTTYDQGDPVVSVGYPSTCSGGVSGNYSFTYVDGVVTVLKKGLTVTASSDTVFFGDPAPAISPSYSGFITGEDAGDLTTAPTCSTTYTPSSLVAGSPYPSTCSGGVSGNYAFTYVPGTVTVRSWTLKGFYQPVDMGHVWNTVKGGSTVPLKFEVFKGTTELTSTGAIGGFRQQEISCGSDAMAPSDAIEFTTTGGTSLRYDATAGQFIQNWQTPKTPGLCYVVTMTTQDASTLWAEFKIK